MEAGRGAGEGERGFWGSIGPMSRNLTTRTQPVMKPSTLDHGRGQKGGVMFGRTSITVDVGSHIEQRTP